MLRIVSSDKIERTITKEQARKSKLLEVLAKLPQTEEPLQILVDSKVLEIIVDFMRDDIVTLSESYNPLEIRFNPDDCEKFCHYDISKLIEICNAANYLNYPYLLELCCKLIANKIRHKSTNELKELFEGSDGDGNLIHEVQNDFDWLSSSEG